MVSVTSGLAALAIIAVAALWVGTPVVAGASPFGATGYQAAGQGNDRCDVSDAVHAIIGHRTPGETVGSVISEIAKQCRPLIRH